MKTLRDYAYEIISQYLDETEESDIENLYQLVMEEAEAGLLEATLEFTRGNQSEAARLLDLNRATIKRKLQHYHAV